MAGTIELKKKDAEVLLAKYISKELGDSQNLSVKIIADDSHRCDCGIVIALQEEFTVIFPLIKSTTVVDPDFGHYYYLFDYPNQTTGHVYSCVAMFIGAMGPTKAALATDRLLNSFSLEVVVNIGIAGSLDSELVLGDVIVAEQADDYMYESTVVPGHNGNDFEFKLSGDPYKTSPPFVEHARNLPFAHAADFANWCDNCGILLRSVVNDTLRFDLLHKGLVRETPKMLTGHLASSTVVGAASAFVDWLKGRDRKYLAIEMEAAGVLTATHGKQTFTVIIRGISDFSDERKSKTDKIAKGAMRRYAMENAVNMLLASMRLGLLPSRTRDEARAAIAAVSPPAS